MSRRSFTDPRSSRKSFGNRRPATWSADLIANSGLRVPSADGGHDPGTTVTRRPGSSRLAHALGVLCHPVRLPLDSDHESVASDDPSGPSQAGAS